MLTLALTLSAKLFISLSSNSSAPPTLPLGRGCQVKLKQHPFFPRIQTRTQAYSCKIKEAKQTSNITSSETSDIAIEGDFTQRWPLWIKSTLGKGGGGVWGGKHRFLSDCDCDMWVFEGRSHEQRIVRSHLHNLTHSLKDFRAKERLRAVYGKQTTITDGRQPEVDFLHHWGVVWLKLSGKSSL